MNEELQRKLVEILSSIQEAAKAGGDFAMAQLPDIAQSYVTYGRIINTVYCVVWLAVFIACLCAALWGVRSKAKTEHGGMTDARVSSIICGGFIGFLSMIPLGFYSNGSALVWFAPKVWLLKELAGC